MQWYQSASNSCGNKICFKNHVLMFKNYRPVSLLPTCGKIFECLLDSEIYLAFSENDFPEAVVWRCSSK